jgi:hypothetical protein
MEFFQQNATDIERQPQFAWEELIDVANISMASIPQCRFKDEYGVWSPVETRFL